MPGKAAGGDEDGVAPERHARRPRVSREPHARRAGDPPPLGCADRNRGCLEIGARLDLDEGDHPAAAGDKVDLAARDGETLGEDRIALEAQQPGRDRLGLEAITMRAAPPLGPLPSAAPHRRAPASLSARA